MERPAVTATIKTRLGDGSLIEISRDDLRSDLEAGTLAASTRAKVAPLASDELAHLFDIFASNSRFTGVDIGAEVILSIDGSGNADSGSSVDGLVQWQNHLGADILELWNHDYSFKAVKTVLSFEAQAMRAAQRNLVAPVQYGAMPDLGRYSMPDGPCPNWSQLLPEGRIGEARASQEEAVEQAVRDMVFVAEGMWEAGADAIDFDTAGAAGDADFLATLRAVELLRQKLPDIGIEVGMSTEFVLGMHGELAYAGRRLAGMWAADQLAMATQAGATVFGPAVTVDTGRTVAWNTARTLTLVKPCVEQATIPVHLNVGMGVGGVPMALYCPVDATARVSRAAVDILRLDGL
jgi:dimethylamine--corrinoid protein Co-methyltransferase